MQLNVFFRKQETGKQMVIKSVNYRPPIVLVIHVHNYSVLVS